MAARLPDIETLRQRCQAVAMLDAILSPDWESRYFSYTQDWGGFPCAQIRNGSGDDCFITFGPAGAFIRGFDHESSMTPWRVDPPKLWPGLVDNVPAPFAEFLTEPAFGFDGVFATTASGEPDPSTTPNSPGARIPMGQTSFSNCSPIPPLTHTWTSLSATSRCSSIHVWSHMSTS